MDRKRGQENTARKTYSTMTYRGINGVVSWLGMRSSCVSRTLLFRCLATQAVFVAECLEHTCQHRPEMLPIHLLAVVWML